MAKKNNKPAPAAKADKKGKKKGGLGWQGRAAALMVLLGSLAVMETTILIMLGLLPTFVAVYVDKDPRKMSGFTIGAMNMAAVVAFVIMLWEQGASMPNAVAILTNPTTLMMIYFAAWVGWLLHFFIPPIVAEFVKKSAQARQKKIKTELAKILADWGDGVRSEFKPQTGGAAPQPAMTAAEKKEAQAR